MSKLTKIILIVAAIPVALFIILAVILKIAISETSIKEHAIPALESQLHRAVEIEHASIQVFPSIGIVLENLQVSDDPEFSSTSFLRLENFTLGIRLFPLLGGNITIDEVGISGLAVHIIKNENGVFNFSSMLKTETGKTDVPDSTQSDEKSGLKLTLDNFHIDRTNLTYDDLSSGNSAKLENLNYKLSIDLGSEQLALNHRLSIEKISLATSLGNLLTNIPLELSQDLDYNLKDDFLTINKTDFKFSSFELDVKGDVKGIQDSVKVIHIAVKSGETDLTKFLSLVPASLVKQVSEIQTRGTFEFSANVNGILSSTQIPKVDYLFSMKNGYFKYSSLPAALSEVFIDLNGTENSLDLSRFSASVKNSTVKVSAKVSDFKDPEVDIKSDVNINLGDIKDFYPLEEKQSVSGSVTANVLVSGKPLNAKTLKGSGKITFDKLSVRDKSLPKGIQEINGSFSINNDFALLEKLKIEVGSSDIELNGKVNNYLGLVLKPDSVKLIPTFSASLLSNNLKVSDFVDLNAEKTEEVKTDSAKTKQLPLLPNVEGKFTASIKNFSYDSISAKNTSAIIEIKNQQISLTNTKTNVFGGSIGLDGNLLFKRGDNSTYKFNMKASQLKSTEFLSLVPSVETYTKMGKYLKGDISVSGDFNGILYDSLSPKLDAVYALGTVGIANGNLSNHPMQVGLGKYLGLEEFNNLTLDNWNMGMEIKEGKLYVKDLKASSKSTGLDVEANGWQSLDQSIDYDVTLHLPKWMSDKMSKSEYGKVATSYFTDSNGKIVVDLKVTGKYDDPSIAPDPTKSAGRAMNALTGQAKDAVNKKVEEKKEEVKKEADKAVEDAKKKAEEEAKKKLKKLFGN